MFSRWFNWRGGIGTAGNENAIVDEYKEQEVIWKIILDKAIKMKVEGSRIQALRVQY